MGNTYNAWSEKEEAKLVELFKQGLTNAEIMAQLNRNKNSITHRIAQLKERKVLIGKRRTKSNEDNYYKDARRTIENFKNRRLKTRHKGSKLGKIFDDNFNFILAMDQRNQPDNLSDNTRANYIRYLNDFALHLENKSFLNTELTKDIEPYIIKRQGQLKQSAFQPIQSTLKQFYQFLLEKNPSKDSLLEIYNFLNKKKRNRKTIEQAEEKVNLNRLEVTKLVAAIKGNSLEAIRNRALVACAYDSGARISEILAVRQRDTKADDKVPRLWFPISKTKPRYSHMLKFSLPYLLELIKAHEFWDNPDAPLFYSQSTSNFGDPLSPGRVGQILSRALKISGIKKKISLHSLRHSKAYHCAEEGMMVSEANKLFGWAKTSGMFMYYTAIAQKELEIKELERAGKLTPEQLEARKKERNAFVMKECLRCHTKVLPDQFVCGKCGLALNKEVAAMEIEKEEEFKEERRKMKIQVMALVEKTKHPELSYDKIFEKLEKQGELKF